MFKGLTQDYMFKGSNLENGYQYPENKSKDFVYGIKSWSTQINTYA